MSAPPSNSAHESSEPEVVNPAEWVGGSQRTEPSCAVSDVAACESCEETREAVERMRYPGAWLKCAECGRAHARDRRGAFKASLAGAEPELVEIRDAQLVSAFVGELEAWARHRARLLHLEAAAARPSTSASASARIAAIATVGILGTGNSGSKGVWSGEGPADALADAAEASETLDAVRSKDYPWSPRLAQMPEPLAQVAVWIRDETRGESPPRQRADDPVGYVLEFAGRGRALGRRVTGLSLAEVVGLSNATPKQRARWEGKLSSGDSAAAREGMREAGGELLIACARAWFGLPRA